MYFDVVPGRVAADQVELPCGDAVHGVVVIDGDGRRHSGTRT